MSKTAISKTISNRKLASARANGAKSRGPKTPEGKARASQNATRHGLCSPTLVLSTENRDEYDALLRAHLVRFQPSDQIETCLVQTMVSAMWRERRSWSIETESLERKMAKASPWVPDWNDLSPAAQTALAFQDVFTESPLGRYETRMSRQYDRARKTLMELRKSQPVGILPKEPNPEIGQLPNEAADPPVPPPTDACEPSEPLAAVTLCPNPERTSSASAPQPVSPLRVETESNRHRSSTEVHAELTRSGIAEASRL